MTEKKTILVVDDELENIQTIFESIESLNLNFTVFRAKNGQAALTISEKKKPDIIITDWDMPEMSGLDLIRNLKENPQTCDIPVIMCTGVMLTSENLKTALQAGAFDYIRKPIDKVELEARLASALERNTHIRTIHETNKQLMEMNAMKDKFFSIIAHDLKNPFNVLMGGTELLENYLKNGKIEKIAPISQTLNKTTKNTYKLLENLLEWAQLQTGKMIFTPKLLDISFIASENVSILSHSFAQKQLQVETHYTQNCMAEVDVNMINTVIRNLLTNAIKFTHTGGKITIGTILESNQFVEVYVQDSGVGIPEKLLPHLFHIDSKYSTPGTNKETGTGLGLILCREFIEKHNGTIAVESEVGKGSRFSFRLGGNLSLKVF